MTITKEGTLASFYTVNKAPIKHLKVYFSPKQAGTGDPSPDNVREISGWNNITAVHTGKNLIISDDPTNLEKTYTHTSTGSTLYDASTQSVYSQGNGVSLLRHWNAQMNTAGSNCLFIAPDDITVSYSINISHDNTQDFTSWPIRLMKNDEQWSYYRRDKDSSASNLCHKRENVQLSKNDCLTGTFYGGVYWKNLQIEIGPEATKYEPYRGHTYPIDWSSTLGTIYGGYVDLVTGELVETDWGTILDGSNDEFWAANGTDGFYTQPQTTKSMNTILYCNQYTVHSGRMSTRSMSEGEIAMNSTGFAVQVFDTTHSDWRAYLSENPLQLVGQLMEPIVHQLTPTQLSTLIGRNNIWSNADRVEVEYDLAESNDELYCRRNIILKSAPHIETVSGTIATFNTDFVAPIKSCKVNFSPVQEGSGDPSPENVRAISGWNSIELTTCGKNLFGGLHMGQKISSVLKNTTLDTINKTISYPALNTASGPFFSKFKENTRYTIMLTGSNTMANSVSNFYFTYVNGSTAAIQFQKTTEKHTATYISAQNNTLAQLHYGTHGGVTTIYYDESGVFEGVLTTDQFEPYIGSTIPLDWQTTAGTIYGGYVDLIKGELIQEWSYFDLTQINWTYWEITDNGLVWATAYPGRIKERNAAKCNILKFIENPNIWGIEGVDWHTGRMNFCLSASRNITTLNEFKQWLQNFKDNGNTPMVCANMETPIHYQLSPQALQTLRGTNNIWSNANGPVEIKYWTH